MQNVIKILFIYHGNICRSPMAEFIFRDMVEKQNLSHRYEAASAATSTEELGNPVHRGTRGILAGLGISAAGKTARQMTCKDYQEYDYIIGMDRWNKKNILQIIGQDKENKVSLLLDFTERKGQDIADPWYTGDFEATYRDVQEGCRGLLKTLEEK